RIWLMLRSPAPRPVTTMSTVVVKINLTEMLGPPRLTIPRKSIPRSRRPATIAAEATDGRAPAIPRRVQACLERDRRQLLRRRYRAPHRRLQPRVLRAAATQCRAQSQG